MANAKYDKAYQGWIMTYTDRTKFRKDGKYLNRTKKQKDTTYPTLPARQKKLKEAEMLAMAQALEDACVAGKITAANPNASVVAADYLEQLEEVTLKSKTDAAIEARKKIIVKFTTFLREHRFYKKFTLEQISRAICREFLGTLVEAKYAPRSVNKMRKALAVVWDIIIDDLEDKGSDLEVINHWRNKRILNKISQTDDDREKEGRVYAIEKRPYTMQQVREIIARHNYKRPMLACIWRLGFLTGWRIGDIKNIRWRQIDFTNRTLTNVSSKTKRKTVIYLTDKLLAMFLEVKETCKDTSPDGVVFYYRDYQNTHKHNRAVLDEMGLDAREQSGKKADHIYTFHSLRGTIKTELKKKDYNQSRLDYLLGHKGVGVYGKHYDKFIYDPEGSTRDILEFLESVLDAEDSDN